jgi:hypothetical protein
MSAQGNALRIVDTRNHGALKGRNHQDHRWRSSAEMPYRFREPRMAVLGAEDEVDRVFRQRLRHGVDARAPGSCLALSGLSCGVVHCNRRALPWAGMFDTFGVRKDLIGGRKTTADKFVRRNSPSVLSVSSVANSSPKSNNDSQKPD